MPEFYHDQLNNHKFKSLLKITGKKRENIGEKKIVWVIYPYNLTLKCLKAYAILLKQKHD